MKARTIFAVCSAVCSVTLARPQGPVFSTRVEAVRLDVLVSDGAKPIRELTAADFEVRDNGVLQTIDHVAFEQIPLSVALTLDISASVVGSRIDHLRNAGLAVLEVLRPKDEAALITFSHALTQNTPLTRKPADVAAALHVVRPKGETALTDGVYAGICAVDGVPGRGLVVVFSDGSDTSSWLSADMVVDAARRSEVVVYAVSAGARKPSFLQDVTHATGGRLYEVESTRSVRAVFLAALEEFRQRYVISYSPRGVPAGGWHSLDVRVKGRRATVRARPGYYR